MSTEWNYKMQNKPVVLFDIDYTLFDKDIFLDSLFISVGNLFGMERNEITEIGKLAYKENIVELDHFDPKYFSLKIAENLDKLQDLARIEDLVLEKYNNPESLYPETLDTVNKISEIATVGIFSKGHDRFQKNKINKFRHLLKEDHIYITNNKYEALQRIADKYSGVKLYLVDDLLDILYSAKKLKADIMTIWVKRGIYAKNQEAISGFSPDAEIENLSEVVKIVKSNL